MTIDRKICKAILGGLLAQCTVYKYSTMKTQVLVSDSSTSSSSSVSTGATHATSCAESKSLLPITRTSLYTGNMGHLAHG